MPKFGLRWQSKMMPLALLMVLALAGCSGIPVSVTGVGQKIDLWPERPDQPVVEGEINGVKGKFLLDTGAQGMFLSESFCRKAGLAIRPHREADVSQMRLGGVALSNFRAEVLNLNDQLQIDGLIGCSVLFAQRFTLNMREGYAILGGPPGTGQAVDITPIRDGLIEVSVTIAGRKRALMVDTGTTQSMVDGDDYWGAMHQSPVAIDMRGATSLLDSGRPWIADATEITMGGNVYPLRLYVSPTTWTADILGSDLLRRYLVTIDREQGKLYLAAPNHGGSEPSALQSIRTPIAIAPGEVAADYSTPLACLQTYIRALQHNDLSAAKACWANADQNETEYIDAIEGLQIALRQLSHMARTRIPRGGQEAMTGLHQLEHTDAVLDSAMEGQAKAEIKIEGNTATITLTVTGEESVRLPLRLSQVHLRRVDGQWKRDIRQEMDWPPSKPWPTTKLYTVTLFREWRRILDQATAAVDSGKVRTSWHLYEVLREWENPIIGQGAATTQPAQTKP